MNTETLVAQPGSSFEGDSPRVHLAEPGREAQASRDGELDLDRVRDLTAAVLDTQGALVVVLDRQGRIVRFNRACAEATGYSFEEVRGRSFFDFLLLPEEAPAVRRVFDALSAGAFPNKHENYWVGKDGRRCLIAWSNTALLGRDGVVEHVIGTGIDVTEQRAAEAALRRAHVELEARVAERTAELRAANERLRAEVRERQLAERALRQNEERRRLLCASAPIGIFEADASGRCTYSNERVAAVTGLAFETFWGDAWVRRAHPQDREAVAHDVDLVRREGRAFCREFRLVTPDNDVRWIMARTATIRGADGRPVGTVGTASDVTDRRRAEDEIRCRENELARLARVYTVGEMAATLAHELSQPLAAIGNYAQGGLRRLEASADIPGDVRHALDCIAAEAARAGHIVRTVRSFIRKHDPEPAPVRVNALVTGAARLAEPEVRRWDAALRLELAKGLPDVTADEVQIQQVIVNLLRNGLEAMRTTPMAERQLCVRTAQRSTSEVEVTIADRGCGLAPGAAARIFEPFYTTKPDGVGMGLSICRSLVQAHGGRIWVESQCGHGARFHFTLRVEGSSEREHP